jgi:hypothetical protein
MNNPQLFPSYAMKNHTPVSNIIDLQEILSRDLGLPYPLVREAAPIVFELSLRIRELMFDVVNEKSPTGEAYALAQAMAATVLIEASSNLLDVDPDDLLCRLIEAGHRGLFDIRDEEASPRVNELFNRYMQEQEESDDTTES